ncbi:hypothetical protein PG985_004592 [Apiospora marii]
MLSCVKHFNNDYDAVRPRERNHVMRGVFKAGWNNKQKPIVPAEFAPKDLGMTQVGTWKHATANRLVDRRRQASALAKPQEAVKPQKDLARKQGATAFVRPRADKFADVVHYDWVDTNSKFASSGDIEWATPGKFTRELRTTAHATADDAMADYIVEWNTTLAVYLIRRYNCNICHHTPCRPADENFADYQVGDFMKFRSIESALRVQSGDFVAVVGAADDRDALMPNMPLL